MNVIAGLHDVRLALEQDAANVIEVFVDGKRKDKRMIQVSSLAAKRGIPTHRVDKDELEHRAEGVRHQGVVAYCRERPSHSEASIEALLNELDHPPLILVLDGVQDPHNLGACLRTVDGSGADAVIVPADRACGITPVVSKVAAGAANSVPLFTVNNLSRTLDDLKALGIWIIGTAEDAGQDVWQMDFSGPCAVVLGGEGSGMRPLTRKHCDLVTRIPMAGVVESLNVSVATGVVLYEVMRQRLS